MTIGDIQIVGSGAVGHYLAYRMQAHDIPFKLINRQGRAINSQFAGFDGSTMALSSSHGKDTSKISRPHAQESNDGFEIVFFTIKAFDLQTAVQQKLRTLEQPAVLICLCNGAVEFTLQKLAVSNPQHIWRIGLCTVGISRNDSQIFQQKSQSGIVHWGPLTKRQETEQSVTVIERNLLQRIENFAYKDNILPFCHKKWLFNMTINTLCAAKRLASNGALLAHRDLVVAVFNESYQLGIELFGPWPFIREQLLQETMTLIAQSGSNENSMAVDVRLGRKTEVAFLSGLAYNAAKYPLLMELTRDIQAMFHSTSGN